MTYKAQAQIARPYRGCRAHRRYDLDCEVRFRATPPGPGMLAGRGRTINMSAAGVLFESELAIPVGTTIELSIAWPVQLEGKIRLTLFAIGRVVRASDERIAVKIGRSEFRVGGAVAAP